MFEKYSLNDQSDFYLKIVLDKISTNDYILMEIETVFEITSYFTLGEKSNEAKWIKPNSFKLHLSIFKFILCVHSENISQTYNQSKLLRPFHPTGFHSVILSNSIAHNKVLASF